MNFVFEAEMHWMNIKFLFSSLFMQPQDVNFHGQEQVYGDLGEEMLEHAFEGKSNEQKKMVRMTSKKYFSNIVKVLLLLRFS